MCLLKNKYICLSLKYIHIYLNKSNTLTKVVSCLLVINFENEITFSIKALYSVDFQRQHDAEIALDRESLCAINVGLDMTHREGISVVHFPQWRNGQSNFVK